MKERWVFWGFALCVALLAVPLAHDAHADAIDAPPDDCPAGRVPVSDHGGPRCELAPPDDCPPGYRGVTGGECVLHPCQADTQCGEGNSCREVSVCQEYRQLHWNGWWWEGKRPVQRDNFFAGPPSPPPEGPAPYEWIPLGICERDGPCNSPAECRPLGLCHPNVVQQPTSRAKVYRRTPMQPTNHPGGCGKGCTVSRSELIGSALLFVGVALAAVARRRGRV